MATKNTTTPKTVATKQPLKTERELLLAEAHACVMVDRNAAYGNPVDNFANIAGYWNNYLTARTGHSIMLSPQDIAHMMILTKVARLSTNLSHRDSLVDIAGYAACGADCRTN